MTLHRQLAQTSPDKLTKLLKSAGRNVSDEIVKINRKSPARPIVGTPMATSCKECVAVDFKFYNGKNILHLVEHERDYQLHVL